MNRRNFLQQTSLTAAALSVSSIAFSGNKKQSSFRVGFLTDVHLKPTDIAETGMRKAYKHANELKPKLDFIVNGGDSIMDALKANKIRYKSNGMFGIKY